MGICVSFDTDRGTQASIAGGVGTDQCRPGDLGMPYSGRRLGVSVEPCVVWMDTVRTAVVASAEVRYNNPVTRFRHVFGVEQKCRGGGRLYDEGVVDNCASRPPSAESVGGDGPSSPNMYVRLRFISGEI